MTQPSIEPGLRGANLPPTPARTASTPTAASASPDGGDRADLSPGGQAALHQESGALPAGAERAEAPAPVAQAQPSAVQSSSPAPEPAAREDAKQAVETQQAAAHAAQAQSGPATVKDQLHLEHIEKLQQTAAEAHALTTEISGLEDDIDQSAARLTALRQRPQTPALSRDVRALESHIEEQHEALAQKRTRLDELRHQLKADGIERQGWQGVDQARLEKLRAQQEMEREAERLGTNLRYIGDSRGDAAADMTDGRAGTALADDVSALQHVIRTRVQASLDERHGGWNDIASRG